VPSAILTSLLDVGASADLGTVLYTADQEPVVAHIGDLPAWRTLARGVDDGADGRQLEENLVTLDYGDRLDVDETFTADTAAAVEAWETDLGRAVGASARRRRPRGACGQRVRANRLTANPLNRATMPAHHRRLRTTQ
jgi:hypothetical protein